ncbi:MAG TPA: hypothetical protein VMV84_03145 [Dehalococcoidales bacterium]|nr:hypothetical protein [Dehalococcoidales bacterium]
MPKKIFLILLALSLFLVSAFYIMGCGSPTESTPSPDSPNLGSTPAPVTNITAPSGDAMYVAHAGTGVLHFIDCILAEEIPETARVWFAEGQKQEAIDDWGYTPCTRCNP